MTATDTCGFDATRLEGVAAFLKERYLDTGKLPHAQLLISRHGQIAHFSSQGAARDGAATPIDERSIFRIASMTKPITSVGFMMLVEAGKVALDTPVHHVLPEFAQTGVFAGGGGGAAFAARPLSEPMRMVDLLRHTAGLTYGFQYRSNVDAGYRAAKVDADNVENWHGGQNLDGFVDELGKMPLEFAPGEAWNYSVATDVLGAVIQRVSGMPFDQYLSEKVFAPLAMEDTGFHVPQDKLARLTDCYTMQGPTNALAMYDRAEDSVWRTPPTLVSGGGGLVSTALDYHRFCQMCANGGTFDGARLLGRKTIELMTMNHLPGRSDLSSMSRSMFSETQNAGTGFGLGFAVTEDVTRAMLPGSAGEYYWGGMFSTSFFIDPVENLHMVFMTQAGPSSVYPIRRELKTLIYSALT